MFCIGGPGTGPPHSMRCEVVPLWKQKQCARQRARGVGSPLFSINAASHIFCQGAPRCDSENRPSILTTRVLNCYSAVCGFISPLPYQELSLLAGNWSSHHSFFSTEELTELFSFDKAKDFWAWLISKSKLCFCVDVSVCNRQRHQSRSALSVYSIKTARRSLKHPCSVPKDLVSCFFFLPETVNHIQSVFEIIANVCELGFVNN